jgi:hypothetical protein
MWPSWKSDARSSSLSSLGDVSPKHQRARYQAVVVRWARRARGVLAAAFRRRVATVPRCLLGVEFCTKSPLAVGRCRGRRHAEPYPAPGSPGPSAGGLTAVLRRVSSAPAAVPTTVPRAPIC